MILKKAKWIRIRFTVQVKLKGIYVDIAGHVKKSFDTWSQKLLSMKNKKVKIKIELGGKIMKEFVALRPKI